MTEEQALLESIYREPDDDTPRLVYADWLQEHDHPERAELIRVQCEIETLRCPECRNGFCTGMWKAGKVCVENETKLSSLREREDRLIKNNGYGWLDGTFGPEWKTHGFSKSGTAVAASFSRGTVQSQAIEFTFRRGFPETKPGLPFALLRTGQPVWVIEGGLLDLRNRGYEPDAEIMGPPLPNGMVEVKIHHPCNIILPMVYAAYAVSDFTRTVPVPHELPTAG